MKKIRTVIKNMYKAFAACAVLSMLFASCDASDAEIAAEGNFIFRLSLPPALSVDTKAGSIGETSIDDVWVIQFDGDGKMIAAKNFGEGVIKQGEKDALLVVTTDGFSNINSTFRVLGNFGSDQADLIAFSKTAKAPKADLQKIVVKYPAYKTERNLLVSNDIEYKSKSDNGDKAVIIAPLSFAYARIDVKWTSKVAAPAKCVLSSIKAYGLPDALAIDSRGGKASGVYPATATGSCDVATVEQDGTLSAGGTFKFFMPENLRGVGRGMSFQEKNIASYGPGGSLKHCTYIELAGSYYYSNSAGDAPVTDPISVVYRLYLGGNLMNDYNIRRGYYYTITVEISGANSGDVRVTITNGGVVVFDKVDTITKEVDFR